MAKTPKQPVESATPTTPTKSRGRPRKHTESITKTNLSIKDSVRAASDEGRQQLGLIEGTGTITMVDYVERALVAYNERVSAQFQRYIKSKTK